MIRKDLRKSDEYNPSDVHVHPTQIPKRQESRVDRGHHRMIQETVINTPKLKLNRGVGDTHITKSVKPSLTSNRLMQMLACILENHIFL